MAEEGEKATLEVDELPKVITPEDLDAKFKIIALDQASTPISNELQKRNLVEISGLLMQLGVSGEKIKEELVRLYDLPKTFLEVEEVPEPQPTEAPQPPQGGAPGPDLATMQAMLGGGI